MKHHIKELPHGFYCLIFYKTFRGFPYWFKAYTFSSYDDLADFYNMNNKPLTIPEMLKEKQRLEKELDALSRLLREQIYKNSEKVK